MTVAQYSVVAHDWINLEFILNDLTKRVVGQEVHPTSSPTFADITLTGDLNITGDVDITGDLDVGGTATFDALTVTDACALSANSVVFQPGVDATDFFQILDADGGTTVFHIDTTNELVGIGTSQPEAVRLLTLVKTDGADALFIKAADSSDSSTLGFGVNTATGYSYIQSHKVGVGGVTQPLRLYVGNTHQLEIGTDGTANFQDNDMVTTGTIDASAGEVLVEDNATSQPAGKSDGYVGVAKIGPDARIYFTVEGVTYYITADAAAVSPVTGNPIGLGLLFTYA